KAARIANFIALNYVSNQVALKTGTAEEVTTLLEDRVGQLQAAVEQAEQAVETFKTDVGYVAFANNPARCEAELIEVSQHIVAARPAAEPARRQYEQIAPPGNLEDLFALVDTPVAADLRRQLNEKSAELTRTGGTLGERHPMIVSLR